MNKLYLFLATLFLSSFSFSQNQDDHYQTIFGNTPIQVSGTGGFNMSFSSIGTHYGLGTGGSGGIILNNQLILGGYGEGLTLDNTFTINNTDFDNVSMGHGGLWFGYIMFGNAPIHATAGINLGWGTVTLSEINATYEDNIFVVNPNIGIEFNITRFFRIALEGQYLFTSGINKFDDISNSDFSGPGGKLSFRFGWF